MRRALDELIDFDAMALEETDEPHIQEPEEESEAGHRTLILMNPWNRNPGTGRRVNRALILMPIEEPNQMNPRSRNRKKRVRNRALILMPYPWKKILKNRR